MIFASQWFVVGLVLSLFYHPAGNPTDNGSGGKPYNEIYQVHFTFSNHRVIQLRVFLAIPRPRDESGLCVPQSQAQREPGVRVVFDRIIMSGYLRRIK
jgi:hypothetical protein